MLRGMVVFVVLFFSLWSHSQTQYSQYISNLQEKFGNIKPDRPIIYLDRDILKAKFAQLGSKLNEQVASEVIVKFVLEKTGRELSGHDAETLFHRLNSNANTATPLKSIDDQEVCVIVPSNPNLNKQQSLRRLLHWDALKNEQPYKGKEISVSLSREINAMTSDIHETFHCLDDWFLPNSAKYHIDPHMIHRSENFAEMGALLYMKSLGYKNINKPRAHIRIVGSYMSQLFLPKAALEEPLPWGTIYNLQKSIFQIDKIFKYEVPSYWDIESIVLKAKSMTELFALNSHEFHGLSRFHEDPEGLQANIDHYKTNDFDYIKKRFLVIEQYIKEYKAELDQAFKSILIFTERSEFGPGSPPTFEPQKHCPAINYSADSEVLSQQIDRLRETYYFDNSPHPGLEYMALERIFDCIHMHQAKKENIL